MKTIRWNSRDLELLPDDGNRYEIVDGYWIINWQERRLEIYRRQEGILELDKTLGEENTLQSPLLPGFSCSVGQLFTTALR